MSDYLSFAVLVVLALAAWLLPKYLEARVTNAARGAVDEQVGKALGEHKHQLDKQLEEYKALQSRQSEEFRHALSQEQARYSQDYSLFAARRNEVYAETYAALERVRGTFAPHFSAITIGPTWDHATGPDLLKVGESEHASEGERAELARHVQENRLDRAREFAATLYERISLRTAHLAFRDFKNTIVLNALYYSPDVDRLLTEATHVFAAMAATALDLEHLERLRPEQKDQRLREADAICPRVRSAMRAEMQAGFRPAPPGGAA